MKKILILAVVLVAMTFASCGSKTSKSEVTTDSTTVVTDSTTADSVAVADITTVK